jgi:hypothetical protein
VVAEVAAGAGRRCLLAIRVRPTQRVDS